MPFTEYEFMVPEICMALELGIERKQEWPIEKPFKNNEKVHNLYSFSHYDINSKNFSG